MQKIYKNILILIAGFCVLHLIFGGKVFLGIALTVLILSTLSEKAAILIDKVWLWIGGTLGKINAAILLFIIYHVMLIPIALLSRIGGKDPMQLKAPKDSNFRFKRHKYVAEDLQNPW
ncbi:MAG: hypothetical protein JKX84_00225 [Flavobacteriales bacterium]|nr:hypothetical protein [Flavobacteriales bacterium]